MIDKDKAAKQFPNHRPGRGGNGNQRKNVTFVLQDDIKVKTLDTAAEALNIKHQLGYRINRNHVVDHLIATHPLTKGIEKELRHEDRRT